VPRSSFRNYKRNAVHEDPQAQSQPEGSPAPELEAGGDFTAREAGNLLGHRVTALPGLLVPPGTRGTITDSRRYTSGWLMFITWDNLANGTGDWLTKREAVHHLKW